MATAQEEPGMQPIKINPAQAAHTGPEKEKSLLESGRRGPAARGDGRGDC